MSYLRGDDPRPEGCIFCHKAESADDVAEQVLVRTGHVFVTLNRYPYNNGHLLIVPYAHVPDPGNLPVQALTDMGITITQALAVLRRAYGPDGFNVGANIGAAAGAGIADHFHIHVVPRWNGDTNYMTIISQTRMIPEWLEDTYNQLRAIWEELFPGTFSEKR